MASTGATGFVVITTGAAGTVPAGWINSGCVLVMLIAGAAAGVGRGKTLMRAVSFFGPRCIEGAAATFSSRAGGTGRLAELGSAFVSIPGGLGNGCKSGEDAGETGGVNGGRRGKTFGASVLDSAEGSGVILGGNRRIGVTGVREGKTIRAVSRFATLGIEAACSGRGGSAMRTVSFLGSAMSDQRAIKKIAQTGVRCHSLSFP
jgi:hypothetical protein